MTEEKELSSIKNAPDQVMHEDGAQEEIKEANPAGADQEMNDEVLDTAQESLIQNKDGKL